MRKKIILSVFMLLTFFICFILYVSFANVKTIKNGIKIEGVSFSGYSKEKALERLAEINGQRHTDYKVIFKYKEKIWSIPFSALRVKYDYNKAVESAYNSGRTKGLLRNTLESIYIFFTGKDIQIPIKFDQKIIANRLEIISNQINTNPKNAAIIIQGKDEIIKVPEKVGLKLDIKKTVEIAGKSISKMSDQTVNLIVNQQMPRYTMNDIKDINGEVGRCETSFSTSSENRISNIKNAIKKINGTILAKGEMFSLNKALGPRTFENGYKDAPVIINDELVPGLGGGVCQVATTLYKAVLCSCLRIVERKHHTFPPAYVPIGQDATIAGNNIDLKFINNLGSPVFISCQIRGKSMLIRILSKKSNPEQCVKIESQIIEVIEPGPQKIIRDNTIQTGKVNSEKEEKKGYKAAVFRNIYRGSILISREQISYDFYRPIRGVVRIGTGVFKNNELDVIKGIIPMEEYELNYIEEPDNPPD